MVQLNDEDRLAVDLFLASRSACSSRNGNGAGGDHNGPSSPAPEHLRERFMCVEQVFELLKLLPEPPPSPDLTARTMQFIESRQNRSSTSLSENDRLPPGVYPPL